MSEIRDRSSSGTTFHLKTNYLTDKTSVVGDKIECRQMVVLNSAEDYTLECLYDSSVGVQTFMSKSEATDTSLLALVTNNESTKDALVVSEKDTAFVENVLLGKGKPIPHRLLKLLLDSE